MIFRYTNYLCFCWLAVSEYCRKFVCFLDYKYYTRIKFQALINYYSQKLNLWNSIKYFWFDFQVIWNIWQRCSVTVKYNAIRFAYIQKNKIEKNFLPQYVSHELRSNKFSRENKYIGKIYKSLKLQMKFLFHKKVDIFLCVSEHYMCLLKQ